MANTVSLLHCFFIFVDHGNECNGTENYEITMRIRQATLLVWTLCVCCIWAEGTVIVVDAGSTGTRAYLFELAGMTTIRQLAPPLVYPSAFDVHSNDTLQDLSEVLETNWRTEYPGVEVLIGATGAARQLDSTRRQAWIHDMKLRFKTLRVRVLSGEEESSFGLLSILSQPSYVHVKPDCGWLDMGGSSLQIGWVTDKTIHEHFFPLPPVLSPFAASNVFGRSFSDLGWQTFLADKDVYVRTKKMADPCTLASTESWEKCRLLLLDMLDLPFWYVYNAPDEVPSTFLAVSGFAYIVRELAEQSENTTLADLQTAGQRVCGTPGLMNTTCSEVCFVYVLLHDLFRLSHARFVFHDAPFQDGQEFTWARGMALYHNWQTISHQLVIQRSAGHTLPWLLPISIALACFGFMVLMLIVDRKCKCVARIKVHLSTNAVVRSAQRVSQNQPVTDQVEQERLLP